MNIIKDLLLTDHMLIQIFIKSSYKIIIIFINNDRERNFDI